MKKSIAIFMLAIFTFNMGGYYLLFGALKMQAKQEITEQLDDGQYDESETFEIKIPLTLPYPLQSNGFERQKGQFGFQGEQYQIVKQKYENDVLSIVVLKDTKATQLENASKDFTESSGAQPEGSLNLPIKVSQDYISCATNLVDNIKGWNQPVPYTLYFTSLYQVSLSALGQPPWA